MSFSNICFGTKKRLFHEKCWLVKFGRKSRATTLDNVIDVHINRLRRKVDDQFDRKLIHTVRGVGFVLRKEQ